MKNNDVSQLISVIGPIAVWKILEQSESKLRFQVGSGKVLTWKLRWTVS